MRPYISIDLETTGLDTEKSEVLQIGAVLDITGLSEEELPFVRTIVDNPTIKHAEVGALAMNGWIFKDIQNPDKSNCSISTPETALYKLKELIGLGLEKAEKYDRKNNSKPRKKIEFAGKNASAFDIPLLKNYIKRLLKNEDEVSGHIERTLYLLENNVSHISIDPGSMYYEYFGKVPNLSQINKFIGNEKAEVTHDAYDDALDVIKAIRYKVNGTKKEKL